MTQVFYVPSPVKVGGIFLCTRRSMFLKGEREYDNYMPSIQYIVYPFSLWYHKWRIFRVPNNRGCVGIHTQLFFWYNIACSGNPVTDKKNPSLWQRERNGKGSRYLWKIRSTEIRWENPCWRSASCLCCCYRLHWQRRDLRSTGMIWSQDTRIMPATPLILLQDA